MNELEARALLFQRKMAELPVEFSIPGLPELDGQLSVLEVGGNELSHAAKLAETPNGTDNILAMAAGICKSLVMRDTKKRVFSDNDVEGVAGFGNQVLMPLGKLVEQVNGLSTQAVAEEKKGSSKTQENGSNSSSPENSEGAEPSQS